MKRRKWRWDAPMGAPCRSRDKTSTDRNNTNEFKVPFGLDDNGTLISRVEAEKINKYRCPACEIPLIFRQGEVRDRHFAHKKDTGCSLESVLHKTAKKLVIDSVIQWKSGIGNRPIIRRLCSGCGQPHDQAIPETITGAIEEYRLPSGVRADVGLISDKKITALLEIFKTHSVDEKKKEKLLTFKWMEVAAQDIISNPAVWICRQESLLPFRCKFCIERKRIQLQREIDEKKWHAKEISIENEKMREVWPLLKPFWKKWKEHRDIVYNLVYEEWIDWLDLNATPETMLKEFEKLMVRKNQLEFEIEDLREKLAAKHKIVPNPYVGGRSDSDRQLRRDAFCLIKMNTT